MNKVLLFASLFFFLPLLLIAQKNQDFILTMQKDTLYGKIKLNLKTNVITFDYQGNRVSFEAKTIDNFGIFRKGQTHVYKTITNDWKEEVFVEVLAEGTLNLYRYDTSGNKHYEEDAFDYRYYLSESNEGYIRVTPRSYKNVLKKIVKNQPYLLAQKIGYEDVPRIVGEYNKLVRLTSL